ncbi:MAG: hypothetical protein QW774_02710 [Candidatus Micrarchaeaceae archaeon]
MATVKYGKEWATVKTAFEVVKPSTLDDLSSGFQKTVLVTDKGNIELDSRYFSFLFYKRLIGHRVWRVEEKNVDIKFALGGLQDFFRNYESNIGMYLEAGKKYYIKKLEMVKPNENGISAVGVHATFKEYAVNKPKEVDLYLLLQSNKVAYAKRALNFFATRIAEPSRLQIMPAANISPVIYTEDLNDVFMSIDPSDVRIESNKIYMLTDVGLSNNTVFIRYSDLNGNDFIYGIEGYSEQSNEVTRRAKSIYDYFRKNLDGNYRFFVSAIDITNNMLDYMDTGGLRKVLPSIFRFAKEYDEIKIFPKQRWNEVIHISFGEKAITYYPNVVP